MVCFSCQGSKGKEAQEAVMSEIYDKLNQAALDLSKTSEVSSIVFTNAVRLEQQNGCILVGVFRLFRCFLILIRLTLFSTP